MPKLSGNKNLVCVQFFRSKRETTWRVIFFVVSLVYVSTHQTTNSNVGGGGGVVTTPIGDLLEA